MKLSIRNFDIGKSLTALILIISAILFSPLIPSAHAQSAGRVIGTVNSLQFNNCRFLDGVFRTTCEIDRAQRTINNVRGPRRNDVSKLNNQISQINALRQACNVGDQYSCERIGNISDDQINITYALINACRTGDKLSCRRAEDVLNGNDPTFNRQNQSQSQFENNRLNPTKLNITKLSPTQARVGNCTVDIDPKTGFRTSNPYNCSR